MRKIKFLSVELVSFNDFKFLLDTVGSVYDLSKFPLKCNDSIEFSKRSQIPSLHKTIYFTKTALKPEISYSNCRPFPIKIPQIIFCTATTKNSSSIHFQRKSIALSQPQIYQDTLSCQYIIPNSNQQT